MNRQRPLESRVSLQALVTFLKDGEGVAVFPEGTYYKNKMGPGHVGVVRLILSRLNLPIIPVGVNYSARRTRTVVRINFGKPFYADPAVSARSFLEIVMREIAVLSGFE